MNQQQHGISRTAVGVIAVACLALAMIFWIFFPQHDGFIAALVRVGTVMVALWLALPLRGQSLVWQKLTPVILVVLLLFALRGRLLLAVLPIVIGVAIVAFFVRPRPKRRPTRR